MRKLVVLALLVCCFALSSAAETPSAEERNKALIAKFYEEVWNKGNYDVSDEVFADDYVRNDPRGGNPPPGPRGQKLIARNFRSTCPDCVMTVHRLLADGDFVVGQWTITGTHQPTGKKIEFVGVNIFRFKDGKVAEVWNHRDDLAYSLQTGRATMAPPPPQPPAKPQ